MSNGQECTKCKKESGSLYGNPKAAKPEYLCFDCLDEIAPEYVNKYPGWREREQTKRHRAELARKNFGHAERDTQKEMF